MKNERTKPILGAERRSFLVCPAGGGLSKIRQAPRQNTSRRVRGAQSEAGTPVGVIEEMAFWQGLFSVRYGKGRRVIGKSYIIYLMI
jgi:hypothetical protein